MPDARIPAVFLDWAGTTVDHGSVAPVHALESILREHGLIAPRALVRKHMGLAKKDHIRNLLNEPCMVDQWTAHLGAPPREDNVDAIYARFESRMLEVLDAHANVISGVPEVVDAMRARGMRIAGTTGYTRPMLDRLEALAAAQGFRTDRSLAPEDAGGGRPHPWMCYRIAIELQLYPLFACVKIGDTASDIAEGRNAGMWTIGVTRTGNTIGLNQDDWSRLDQAEQNRLLLAAAQELRSAGAHYTAESVAHTLPILDEITGRIAASERPR